MRQPPAGEPPLSLVPLSRRDCAALAALHAGVFAQAWSEADFNSFLADRAIYGLAIRGREPTGFILCRVVADEAEVLSFGVAPPHRRRGGGRALLALAMAEAVRRGARRMFLEVAEDNLAARALYDSAGFFCVGRREAYYRDRAGRSLAGSAALVLRCDLCDAPPRPDRGRIDG